MSNIEEIKAFCDRFSKYYFTDRITLIHTQLSFNIEDVNLTAIPLLQKISPFNVAFLSHCRNMNVVYCSIPYNPSALFIYVSGDEEDKHPDEPHSIKLSDIDNFIMNINELKIALGTETKLKMENILDKENLK